MRISNDNKGFIITIYLETLEIAPHIKKLTAPVLVYLLHIHTMDTSIFSSFKKFISKKPKAENILEAEKIPSAIKESRIEIYDEGDFIRDFKYPINKGEEDEKNEVSINSIPTPIIINKNYRNLLKKSIVISLHDFGVVRDDLEFIGNSRINGRPIYRYIGSDFSKFDLLYDEVVSLEDRGDFYIKPNSLSNYSEYLSTIIDNNIAYSDYIKDHLEKNIDYKEYHADV